MFRSYLLDFGISQSPGFYPTRENSIYPIKNLKSFFLLEHYVLRLTLCNCLMGVDDVADIHEMSLRVSKIKNNNFSNRLF